MPYWHISTTAYGDPKLSQSCRMGFVTGDSNFVAIRWEERWPSEFGVWSFQTKPCRKMPQGDIDFPCFSLLLRRDFCVVGLKIRSSVQRAELKLVSCASGWIRSIVLWRCSKYLWHFLGPFPRLPICFLSTSDTIGVPWGPDCATQATDVCPFVSIFGVAKFDSELLESLLLLKPSNWSPKEIRVCGWRKDDGIME